MYVDEFIKLVTKVLNGERPTGDMRNSNLCYKDRVTHVSRADLWDIWYSVIVIRDTN